MLLAGRAGTGRAAGGGSGRVAEPMTRDDADEAYDCLSRHARAITRPTTPAAALELVDKASLAQLQRDAIIHYISTGPAVVNLAYRVLKAGTATFVAARFGGGDTAPGERELFAERLIALDARLAGTTASERATGLLDALTLCLIGGRADLENAGEASAAGVGDLLEAAGIAYVLAQLLENPPARTAVAGA
jgi:hypothetical protein